MSTPTIIATLGEVFVQEQDWAKVDWLVQSGVTHFRVNLSRYFNIEDFEQHCQFARTLKAKYQSALHLMVDLPYPGEKVRLFRDQGSASITVEKHESILLTDNPAIYAQYDKVFYTNCPNLSAMVHPQQTLIYADGECTFTVVEINVALHYIVIQANKACCLYARKSLTCGLVLPTQLSIEYLVHMIQGIQPDSLALSFVTCADEVTAMQELLTDLSVKVYSKIETQQGVDHIAQIAQQSHIILGRGDLLLNIESARLWEMQEMVIQAAKQCRRDVVIATGILPSLATRDVPTQAEIIDITSMMMQDVDGLILNNALVHSDNIIRAMELIQHVSRISHRDA